jgi:hypothetical protein
MKLFKNIEVMFKKIISMKKRVFLKRILEKIKSIEINKIPY